MRADFVAALGQLAKGIKERFPDKSDATVLPEPSVPYDVLVQVMDAVREVRPPGTAAKAPSLVLFPDISIGDAPVSVAKK